MDCNEAKPHLSAMASGRVSAEDEGELQAHLESCEDCSLELVQLVSALAPPPVEPESDRLDVEPLEDTLTQQPTTPEPVSAPPAAPSAPPHSDWTVEKIFGNDGGPAAAPQGHTEPPPANPSMILPPQETPAVEQDTPVSPETANEPKSRLVPEAWDFEPADAARDATPPEESLLFAEQALNRRIDDPKRKGAIRVILWAASAIVGMGLLGVSLWMAMGVHEVPTLEITARVKSPAGASNGTDAPPVSVEPPIENPDPVAPPPAPGNVAGDPAPPPSTPPTGAGAVTPVPIKSSLAPKPTLPAPPSASSGTKSSASKPTAAPARSSEQPLPSKGVATQGSKDQVEKPAAAPPRPSVKRDDDDMWPTDDPVHPKQAAAPSAPETRPPAPSGSAATPASGSPAPTAPRPLETVAPTPEAPPAELKPIDRLHAATVQAAKDQDLIALRRLKTTWKNLLRTVVGPDRARAKREYAECLWDIQAMSGRDADQREALLAYRDYLLSAPAGGADARSAARLRELEDALSERR